MRYVIYMQSSRYLFNADTSLRISLSTWREVDATIVKEKVRSRLRCSSWPTFVSSVKCAREKDSSRRYLKLNKTERTSPTYLILPWRRPSNSSGKGKPFTFGLFLSTTLASATSSLDNHPTHSAVAKHNA